MADDVEALRVLVRDDGELRIAIDDVRRVDDLAVDLAGERRLGETGADGCGDVLDGDGAVVLADCAVGKGDGNHVVCNAPKQKSAVEAALFVDRFSNHGRADALLRYRVSVHVSGVITMAVNVA